MVAFDLALEVLWNKAFNAGQCADTALVKLNNREAIELECSYGWVFKLAEVQQIP